MAPIIWRKVPVINILLKFWTCSIFEADASYFQSPAVASKIEDRKTFLIYLDDPEKANFLVFTCSDNPSYQNFLRPFIFRLFFKDGIEAII